MQLNCMVNRELTRRVKFGQEVAWASRAVHADLLLVLSLIEAMDKKAGLWGHATLDESDTAGKVCILVLVYCICACVYFAVCHLIVFTQSFICHVVCLIVEPCA